MYGVMEPQMKAKIKKSYNAKYYLSSFFKSSSGVLTGAML